MSLTLFLPLYSISSKKCTFLVSNLPLVLGSSNLKPHDFFPEYPTKEQLIVLESSFLSWGTYSRASAGHPQIWRCFKLGFLPVHSSYGVFIVALVGTRFNKYIVVSKASTHNLMWSDDSAMILLTISWSVQFYCSAMPVILGVSGIVYWGTILDFLRYRAKLPGHCSPDASFLPYHSPPRSDLTCLILLLSWFSTSALNILNVSKDSDLSRMR